VVTDDGILERQGILGVIKTVYETGGPDVALHIRGPSTYGRKIHELARKIQPMADSAGGRLFLNDRLDIAWTAGADGVHLGQRSLPVRSVRRLVGHDLTIGASVHNEHESAIAEKEGADYAFLGTLFRTPSHHGIEPDGLSLISKMCPVIRDMPFVGIGGITPERVGGVLAAIADSCSL
jgi:thiamine-phosphate pyrophosphorylase